MKIEDGIIKQLADQGYLKLNIKISNMDLFYRADAFSTDIVLLLRVISGKEITVEEYKLIINNVKNHFTQAGFSDIHL